jgi:para-nitrobenzyl esterase
MQSGSCLTSWPAGLLFGAPAGTQWTDRATLDRAGSAFAAAHGCATAACLRALPAGELAGPAFNRPVLPVDPAEALRRGAFARVPVLAGTNLDEFRGFLGVVDEWTPYTPAQFTAALTAAFGDRAGRVAAAYPLSSYADRPGLAWAAVMTDRMFACTTLTTERLLARHNPVSSYEFAERSGPHLDDRYPWGAAHGYELPYLFDGMTWLTGTPQPALAATMVGEWARFAATGTTGWPRFPYARSLAASATGPVDLAAEHRCDLWPEIGDA